MRASTSPAEQEAGTGERRLGPYRLLRPIGGGGMARVYEGRLDSLAGVSTRVAIKVIHPDFAHESAFQELFITEARLSARLEHQNLVRVQQFNREADHYYLVMEFIDGITFRKIIAGCQRQGVRLPVTVIAELGRQVCEGLHYAHMLRDEDGRPLNLVHRDIKPTNLMLNTQGVAKVLDFGISAGRDVEEAMEGVKGTWGYMALEQAEQQPVGGQADLYGVAAVLYELATLNPLFPEREIDEIRAAMRVDEAARRATALDGAYADLGAILVRALQRDPAARHDGTGTLGRALASLVPDPVSVQEALVRLVRDLRLLDPATSAGIARASAARGARASSARAETASRAGPVRAEAQPTPLRPPPPELPPGLAAAVPITPPEPAAAPLPVRTGNAHAPAPLPSGDVDHAPIGLDDVPVRAWNWQQVAAGAAMLVIAVTVGGWVGRRTSAPDAAQPSSSTRPQAVMVAPAPQAPASRPVPSTPAATPAAAPSAGVPSASAVAVPAPVAPPAAPPTPAAAPRAPAPTTPAAPAATAPPPALVPPAPAAVATPAPATTSVRAPQPAAAAPVVPAAPPRPVASASARASAAQGRVSLGAVPRAQVVIDGRYIRYTPLHDHALPAGEHQVLLQTDDSRKKAFSIVVPEEGSVTRVWYFEEKRWAGE